MSNWYKILPYLSQIWLLGNTEHRNKLTNSCFPGSAHQRFEESHHVALHFLSFKASQPNSSYYFWTAIFPWTHPRMTMTVCVPPPSLPSASLLFGLRLWSTWTWLDSLVSSFSSLSFILRATVRLTILKHDFLQVTSLVRKTAVVFHLLWHEVQIWLLIPSHMRHFSISPSSSLF